MNRRALLAASLAAPFVVAGSRFRGLDSGADTPLPAQDTEIFLLYPGGTVVHKHDIIQLENREAWIVGVSGDEITVIRGAYPDPVLAV